MRTLHRLAALAIVAAPLTLGAQTRPDGQHDFDFEIGRWRVHLRRLAHPLSADTTWLAYDGTSIVRPVWGGLANLGELEVDGAGAHVEGLSLRVYDARARQWRIHWANSRDGELGPAMVGGFTNGRGEFYDQEDLDGRPIFARFLFSDVGRTSFRLEQAYSGDQGRTWQTNWIATFTRDSSVVAGGVSQASATPRDFAFEEGTWSMTRRRLKDPLGPDEWTESTGARHIARPVWGGRAELAELELPGAPATFAGSLLHTFDPRSRRWRVYWIDRATARVSEPMIGQLANGRGALYAQEEVAGVTALVRVAYTPVGARGFRTEQAWSLDGGRTWRTYAIDTFTPTSR